MAKPPEILELEKILGFELEETKDIYSFIELNETENLYYFAKYISDRTYLIDNQNKIIGLSLHDVGLFKKRISRFKKFISVLIRRYNFINKNTFRLPKKLQILDLTFNYIENIEWIASLRELKMLFLGYPSKLSRFEGIERIEPLTHLLNLEILVLNLNKIEDISPLSLLKNLYKLDLSQNNISDISSLANLKKLEVLNLCANNIYDTSSLSNLENLEFLYLNNFMFDSFGRHNKNQIKDIVPLKRLKKLIELDLSYNKIQNISLDFLLALPNLKKLRIAGNPIQNIPKEIFNKSSIFELGLGANVLLPVRTYLQDLERGKSVNNDVKLLLLGNGGVGKTQIAKRLAEQAHFVFNVQHDSTHGIVMLQRELEHLNLNIWDFAGQDIYHATHRLFMQTRALFVLVWDVASETSPYHEHAGRRYKNEKLQYWLEYARCFAPESPILVVKNKVDTPDETKQTYLEQTQEYYKTHYPIIEFVQVSAQTGYNFDVLEYWLAESFRQDENLKRQLLIDIPISWAQVRARIRVKQAEQEKTLSVEDFKILCKKEEIPNSWHTLLQYLHDTSVLYYREGYFGNQIILDQAWAIDAVYAVLNRQSFYFRTGKIKKGRLQYADLQVLWKENTDEERKLFIDFMLSTELCFETTENKSYDTPLQERTFVVPQLLPEEKPRAVTFEETERNIRQISEIVEYRFLPSVFIQRFIIKANRFSKVEMMWQHGILLQWNNFYAVAEANYDKKQILIHSTDTFLIQRIKEELEIITNEGKIRAAKPSEGEDPIVRGERFLEGLAGLDKKVTFGSQAKQPMYGIEQEIQGLQNALHILINKKNFFLEELSVASDSEIKFSLKIKLEKLETEIDAYRQKLQQLANQVPANSEIQQLQQEATELKQIIIQKAEKVYNIGNIDKASFS